MKTNHQRGFVATKPRFDCWVGRAGAKKLFIGNDFTNGHRGHARTKAGIKKHWKKMEKRRRAADIRRELREMEAEAGMSEQRTDDGGPAFPRAGFEADVYPSAHTTPQEGMSLRDYFAAQAIAGAADATCDELAVAEDADAAQEHAQQHAKAAYLLADAMLEARKR